MEDLLKRLKQIFLESKDFYPDDDSRQAGYQDAIIDLIEEVEKRLGIKKNDNSKEQRVD